MQHGESTSSSSAQHMPDFEGSVADLHHEIGEINLAYLLLAQRLVKQDKTAAMIRLGISCEMADLLSSMARSQIVKIASSTLMLCSFRLENQPKLQSGENQPIRHRL
jgi:flagellar transcriptional activator FlhD